MSEIYEVYLRNPELAQWNAVMPDAAKLDDAIARYADLLEYDEIELGAMIEKGQSLPPYQGETVLQSFEKDFRALVVAGLINPCIDDPRGGRMQPMAPGAFFRMLDNANDKEMEALLASPHLHLVVTTDAERPAPQANDESSADHLLAPYMSAEEILARRDAQDT